MLSSKSNYSTHICNRYQLSLLQCPGFCYPHNVVSVKNPADDASHVADNDHASPHATPCGSGRSSRFPLPLPLLDVPQSGGAILTVPASMAVAAPPAAPVIAPGLLTLSARDLTWQPSASGTAAVPVSFTYDMIAKVLKKKTDPKLMIVMESQAPGGDGGWWLVWLLVWLWPGYGEAVRCRGSTACLPSYRVVTCEGNV